MNIGSASLVSAKTGGYGHLTVYNSISTGKAQQFNCKAERDTMNAQTAAASAPSRLRRHTKTKPACHVIHWETKTSEEPSYLVSLSNSHRAQVSAVRAECERACTRARAFVGMSRYPWCGLMCE